MLHEPATPTGPDPAAPYKTRLGAVMFVIYTIVFAGFIAVNLINDGAAMAIVLFWGLNVAVLYGFLLIVLALFMAMIYNHLCTAEERRLAVKSPAEEAQA